MTARSGGQLSARGRINYVREFLIGAGFHGVHREEDLVLGTVLTGVPGWRIAVTTAGGVNAGTRLLARLRQGKTSPWRLAVVRATLGEHPRPADAPTVEVGDLLVTMRLEDFAHFLNQGRTGGGA